MEKPRKKRRLFKNKLQNARTLFIAWGIVLGVMLIAFVIGEVAGLGNDTSFRAVELIATLAAFVVQSIFSFSVLRYNADLRALNNEMKRTSDETNVRAEEFRALQFVASNYTVVDFVDYMLLYDEPVRYVNNLLDTKNAGMYLSEKGIDLTDVYEKPGDYGFASLRLPFEVIEGKAAGDIRFSRFEFTSEQVCYCFVPCATEGRALVLHNETDKRGEAVVNLIFKQGDGFFLSNQVVPFSKIRIYFTVRSLLGVAVTGRIELYFTNPLKLEQTGANKYAINSSLFEASGIPKLEQRAAEGDVLK